MKTIEVHLSIAPGEEIDVGELAEADRRIYFQYANDFISHDLRLSPFKLPLRAGAIEHVDLAFGPLPGLIDDSLPDGWGLLLMDRLFRRRGLDPATVSPLDRLLYLGRRTMGALTYHPPAEAEHDERAIDIFEMGKNAQRVYAGEVVDVLPELIRAGGSPGGARPKILVGLKGDRVISGEDDLPDGFEHWMVKFSSKADTRDAGPLEYAYHLMARAAGIDMPEARLVRSGKQSWYCVKRFDRAAGNRRMHVHTFGNLIHANFRVPSTDYADLLKVALQLTRNREDVLRAFRRMVFNVAAHNRDDHAKNFAFVMNDLGEWRLSPAYDLIYSNGPGGEHSMSVAGEGREPSREQMIKIGIDHAVDRAITNDIFDDVNMAVKTWKKFAEEAGVSKKTARMVQSKIVTV